MTLTPYLPALLVPLIVWRVYARYRRLVGVQELRPVRLYISAILLPLLFLLLATGAWKFGTLPALLMGGAAGLALSFVGLKLTKFENNNGQLLYTPNRWIGMGITMLFVGRMAYRMLSVVLMGASFTDPNQNMLHSDLSVAIFGLMLGYYPNYSIGILRWMKRERALPVKPAEVEAEAKSVVSEPVPSAPRVPAE